MPTVRAFLARRLLVAVAVLVLAAAPHSAAAASPSDDPSLPDLATFAGSVANGEASVLRGVYVDGLFALRIVQQADDYFISPRAGYATQFGAAKPYGVTGLLAHNFLSGQEFFKLRPGQHIALIYGDGRSETYAVSGVHRFQAMTPESQKSAFVDLGTGKRLDAQSVFNRFYTTSGRLVFQTCIAADDELSWGRLFIVAEKQ